nr:SpaH/EbpB family LPXTG-anchored major pilin [Leucobacter chromiiresistens]
MSVKKLGHRAKRVLTGVGAVMLAVGTLGLGGSAASAVGIGNIDPTQTGSITITKLTQPDQVGGIAGSGAIESLPAGSLPLEGVEFTVSPVEGVDLTTLEGWQDVPEMTVDEARSLGLGAPQSLTTAADGTATFANLPLGLYLVEETDFSSAKQNGEDVQITSASKPYLVAVPSYIEEAWHYDIFSYPKNSTSEISKTVDESEALGLGSPVAWDISAQVPKLGAGDVLEGLRLTDALDPRLGYVSVSDVAYNGTALAASDYTAEFIDGEVVVTLTAAGLAQVQGDASGYALTFSINTRVTSLGDDGIVKNSVSAFINVNGQENPITSKEDTTEWGALRIVKSDEANGQALAGAVFEVFASEADAEQGANPIAVDGATEFTTGDDGTVLIAGLLTDADTHSKTYYVKEKAAPAGYILSDTVHAVDVVTGGIAAPVDLSISNTAFAFPNLPITGGAGTALFTLGGLIVLAGATTLILRHRRKIGA